MKRILKKRVLSWLLTVALVLSLSVIPLTAYAETGDGQDGDYTDDPDTDVQILDEESGEDPEPEESPDPEEEPGPEEDPDPDENPDPDEEPGPEEDPDPESISLSLLYDDRYSFTDLLEGEYDDYIIDEIQTEEITSFQIKDGSVTEEPDDAVLTQVSDTDVIAAGTGTALVSLVNKDYNEETAEVSVTVEAAPLSLIFLTGQSNMEGMIDNDNYDYGSAVSCEEGQIYSTYAPTNGSANHIANMIFYHFAGTDIKTAADAAPFVPESLTSDLTRSGSELEYKQNSLSASGQGKTGPDSGLAYEWNQLTGDKVWIVNTAWSGTSIKDWVPGTTYYDRADAIHEQVLLTYQAEVNAGHFEKSSILMFWLQGEADHSMSLEDYNNYFLEMYNGFCESCGLDAIGIISVRASTSADDYTNVKDIAMTPPRIAQYSLGASSDYPGIYVVSNVNEQWVTDKGTESYFAETYSGGVITYPTHSGKSLTLPKSVTDVHPGIHYTQIGHNENGITAADGMYTALFSDASAGGVAWRDTDGLSVSEFSLFAYMKTGIIVPSAEPISLAKTVSYVLDGDTVSYDLMTATVTYKEPGTSYLNAFAGGDQIGQLEIQTLDETEPGFVYAGGKWYYFDEDGSVVPSAVVQDSSGEVYGTGKATWWYICDSEVMNLYTGFAQDGSDWVYVTGGQVTYNQNSVIEGTVNGQNGWWYVVGGKVQLSYTGVGDYANDYGWWYIRNGMVDFSYTGLASNKYGCWYVKGGEVDFTFSGFAQNDYGWWYLQGGEVKFSVNGLIQGTIDGKSARWYVVGGEVQRNYTGVADFAVDNSWWYIKDGAVDQTYTGIASNSYGTWYVSGGKVNFSFAGFAQDGNGWWYLQGGEIQKAVNNVIQGTVNGTSGWWYVVGGKVQLDYTGVCDYCNDYGWWYVKNGMVDFSKNSVEQNAYGWWYVLGGQVDFSYTGVANYANDYGWWYLVGGQVDFSKNSVEMNDYGWWYVLGGKVDFSYTGVANYANDYGWWYLSDGKVDFSKNSVEQNDYGWWYVLGGKVDFSYTGVANYANDYGWWYLNGGKVDFDYTGIASNAYGRWNVVSGKVIF